MVYSNNLRQYFRLLGLILNDGSWIHAASFLQRIKIFKRNKYNPNGCDDHNLLTCTMFDLLPTLRWQVFWGPTFKKVAEQDYLLVCVELKGVAALIGPHDNYIGLMTFLGLVRFYWINEPRKFFFGSTLNLFS